MAKKKLEVRMRTYGIHSKWDSDAKELPRLVDSSTTVPAIVDIEFGFIVNIKGGKNQEIDFCIDHPGILDSDGKKRSAFVGSVYIKSNDWDFYLGDTIWAPIMDKLGKWRMSIAIDGKIIAEKTFDVVRPATED